jgi:hypothetical protein
MRDEYRGRYLQPGGIVGYPLEQLNEEVAYLAFHLKWPPDTLLEMEHGDRRQWVHEVANFNERLNQLAGA